MLASFLVLVVLGLSMFKAQAALTPDALPTSMTELIRQARFKEHELSFFVQAVDEDQPAIARQADKMSVLASR